MFEFRADEVAAGGYDAIDGLKRRWDRGLWVWPLMNDDKALLPAEVVIGSDIMPVPWSETSD